MDKSAYNTDMTESLEQFLQAAQRDSSYRVDAVLKKTDFETTERVFFDGATGGTQGPYIRKFINVPDGSNLGSAYQTIYDAQQRGCRFHRLPRIISCYSTSQQTVVVMEYISGITLQEARQRGRVDTSRIFDQVCSAVRELHEQFEPPIIHRDLKPPNIMVSGSDIVLIDFGIARTFNEETEADTTQFGTRAYAPPEQFGFSQTDERSDVYALGLLLFFLETGHEPTSTNRSARFFHPDLDERLRGIVNRATALDPSQRFATVRDLQIAARTAFSAMQPKEEPSQDVPENRDDGASWSNPLPDERPALQRIFGYVRNAAALLITVLCFLIVAACTIDPSISDQTAALPVGLRALLYGTFFLIPEMSLCYLVADKTPLRRRIPFFLRIKGKTEIITAVIIALASFTLFLFLIALLSPAMPPVSR